MITTIKEFKLYENINSNKIRVVRWSKEKILAKDLKPQKTNWGGFDMDGLCFVPYTDTNDWRYDMWKNETEKYHKQKMYPNNYILDISMLPYDTEDKLIKLSRESYSSNIDIRKNVDNILNDMKIYITLSGNEIVEFRILKDSKVKIIDDI